MVETKISVIFREAAIGMAVLSTPECPEKGEFREGGACLAIANVMHSHDPNSFDRLTDLSVRFHETPAYRFFAKLFQETDHEYDGFWWQYDRSALSLNDRMTQESRTARILALLLAAEVAESEGL